MHEFACELRGLADKKRFPLDSVAKKKSAKGTATAGRYRLSRARATRACALPCAAATVLLGISGLLVTAATQTQDGRTVEAIHRAAEAPRCCPRCTAATRVKERPGPRPAT